MSTPTVRLWDEYRKMHDQGHFAGRSLNKHAKAIADLVKLTAAKTLLDYGSGKGYQYGIDRMHDLWGGIEPVCYDPAVPASAKLPDGPFDGVICTDVLEHVPEDELDATLDAIFQRATRFVYLAISTRPARKFLPNGLNAHVTVHPADWWAGKLRSNGKWDRQYLIVEAVYSP